MLFMKKDKDKGTKKCYENLSRKKGMCFKINCLNIKDMWKIEMEG